MQRYLAFVILLFMSTMLAGCETVDKDKPDVLRLNKPVLESVTLVRRYEKTGNIESIALSPDQRLVAIGSGGLSVRVFQLATGKETFAQELGAYPIITSVDFSPDGQHLIAAGGGGIFRIWKVADFSVLENCDGLKSKRAVFLPDGVRMLVASSDGLMMLWRFDPAGREPMLLESRWRADPGSLNEVAVSPDGTIGVAGGSDGAGLWDLETQELIFRFRHAVETIYAGVVPVRVNPVYCVAISPDGLRALTGGLDGTVRLWDCETTEEIHQLAAHKVAVRDVAFSPDGRFAVSCGIDSPGPSADERHRPGVSSMRVWDLQSGRQVAMVQMPTVHAVRTALFFADGQHILTAGVGRQHGGLRVWRMTNSE